MTTPAAQRRRIAALLNRYRPEVRRAFVAAMDNASVAINRRVLIELLEQGLIEGAVALFRVDTGVLFPLQEAIRGAFIAGGAISDGELPRSLTGRFGFDGNHPRAERFIAERGAMLVTNVSDDAIANARKVILAGLEENRGAVRIARDLVGRRVGNKRVGGMVGLTEPQADRMINLRSILSNPDRISEYFIGDRRRYKEADGSFDRQVRKAIREGRALTKTQVDKVTEAYKAKAMGRRGHRVARKEAYTAQAAGRHEAYLQLVESGRVASATIRWQHNLSEDPRFPHVAMNGTVKQVGEDFEFPGGVRMAHPHDARGGVEHSAGCRCTGIYRVKLRR